MLTDYSFRVLQIPERITRSVQDNDTIDHQTEASSPITLSTDNATAHWSNISPAAPPPPPPLPISQPPEREPATLYTEPDGSLPENADIFIAYATSEGTEVTIIMLM